MWAFVLFLLVPFPLTKIPELILILCPIHTSTITFSHMRERGKKGMAYETYFCTAVYMDEKFYKKHFRRGKFSFGVRRI